MPGPAKLYEGLKSLLGASSAIALSASVAEQEDPVIEPVAEQEDPAAEPDPVEDPAEQPAPEDPAAEEPAVEANIDSADYQAGVAATNARWATVLSSEAARNNLEMATDLIAQPSLSAATIVSMCERHGGAGADRGNAAAKELLDRTPKPALGVAGSGAGANEDLAKNARAKAAEKQNAKLGGRGIKAQREAAMKGA